MKFEDPVNIGVVNGAFLRNRSCRAGICSPPTRAQKKGHHPQTAQDNTNSQKSFYNKLHNYVYASKKDVVGHGGVW
jgi:hypothetical protein